MNLIDIASWQKGLDLADLYNRNPDLDGVIVKVSQGTTYVNPCAKEWLNWLTLSRKCTGTYHYLDYYDAEKEARHYVDSVKPWLGKVMLAIDYEGAALSRGTVYLKACLDEVTRLTGIRPLVYCSQSVTQSQDFSAIAAAGYRLWLAQYADYQTVSGFIGTPWQKGSVAPFDGYAIHQYTSRGWLKGWDHDLDFDLFRGTKEDWRLLCGDDSGGHVPGAVQVLWGPSPTVVDEVLANRYGTGAGRGEKLRAAGYDPYRVQEKINELYGIALNIGPLIAGNREYIHSIATIVSSQQHH